MVTYFLPFVKSCIIMRLPPCFTVNLGKKTFGTYNQVGCLASRCYRSLQKVYFNTWLLGVHLKAVHSPPACLLCFVRLSANWPPAESKSKFLISWCRYQHPPTPPHSWWRFFSGTSSHLHPPGRRWWCVSDRSYTMTLRGPVQKGCSSCDLICQNRTQWG